MQKDASIRPPLGTINVILATPGKDWFSAIQSDVYSSTIYKRLALDSKRSRVEGRPVLSFSDEDKVGTLQPHNDALVVTLRI